MIMKAIPVTVAVMGLVCVGACKAPETTNRFDSGDLLLSTPFQMSATREDRELTQSLGAVSMKDQLRPGQELQFSDHARRIIAAYAN